MQLILEDTSVDDLQHAANWTDAVRYLDSIRLEDLKAHVPFMHSQ